MAKPYGEAIKKILAEEAPNTGENTVNSPIPTRKGGITIARELLPDVKTGDEVTLNVVDVDEEKNEVHLEVKREENAETPMEGQEATQKTLPETM